MARDFLNDSSPEPVNQQPQGRDFLDNSMPRESLGMSLGMALPRMASDLGESAFNFANKVPGYLEQAPDQLKALFQTMQSNTGPFQTQGGHPGHAAMQGFAGLNEGINKVAQIPGALAEYGEKRLNLVPHGATEAIKRFGPQDTSQAIGQLFDQPQYPGEGLMRGIGRNIPEIASGGKVVSALNPLKLTNRNIARNIVREGDSQVAAHNTMYNRLWRDADRAGINNVPIDPNLVGTNLRFIQQYKSPKDYRTLEYFNQHPTLSNAQSAVSDLRGMIRSLDEKSRTTSLTGEERHLHDALSNTERHIESNMFMDRNGRVNQPLADRYRAISNSYRENVVPYRYNKDIQAFRNRELVEKQLVERLKGGEFGAKKGNRHPELYRSEALKKALIGLGIGGGILGGGTTGYKYLTGNRD